MMEDVYDTVGAVPREAVSFENVIKPLIDLDGEKLSQIHISSVSFQNFYSLIQNVRVTQNIVKKGPTLITFDVKH